MLKQNLYSFEVEKSVSENYIKDERLSDLVI